MGFLTRLRTAMGGGDLHAAELADALMALHGDRLAVRLHEAIGIPGLEGENWSHQQIHLFVQKMTSVLRAYPVSMVSGDTVAVFTDNHMELLVHCLAIWRAGGVVVPLNAKMRPAEVHHVLADSKARIVIGSKTTYESGVGSLGDHASVSCWLTTQDEPPVPEVHSLASLLVEHTGEEAAPPSRSAQNMVTVFYTSGTTGKPKGTMITSEGLCGALSRFALLDPMLFNAESMAFTALPLAHMYGFSASLLALMAGMPIYQMPTFDAVAVLDILEEQQPSIFIGVPAMYRLLLEAGAEARDLSSVKMWVSAADVVSPDIVERFKQMGASVKLGPFRIPAAFAEGYGMVETSGIVLGGVSLPGMKRERGFVGVPLPGVSVRVIGDDGQEVSYGGEGQLCIQGPGVLKGYLGAREATKAVIRDGWLHTGDMVRRGLLGTIEFINRSSDRLKVGGYSVFPAEIEAGLCEHPGVEAAFVFGEPHPKAGEVPVAVIIPASGVELSADELIQWAAGRMATYKAPRRMVFAAMTDLPLGDTGKVLRRKLPERFGQTQQGEA